MSRRIGSRLTFDWDCGSWEPGQRLEPKIRAGGTCEKENALEDDGIKESEMVAAGVTSPCLTPTKSSSSYSGRSSSRDTKGMAVAAAHIDDRMAYQGVDGVLAFKNSEGRMT